jgi:hypothetical protein
LPVRTNRNAVRSFAKRSGGIFNGPVTSIDWLDVHQFSHPSNCDKTSEERAIIDKNFLIKYCGLIFITEVQESSKSFLFVLSFTISVTNSHFQRSVCQSMCEAFWI